MHPEQHTVESHGRARWALAVVLLVLMAALALAPRAMALEELSREQISPRLVELTLQTPALAAPTRVRVLLPDGYDAAPSRRYPVLYLLHGGGDDVTGWTRTENGGRAEQATAGLPLIVVMPEGKTGLHTDWYNNGAGGQPMWETYHIGELVPWIDGHFRTIARRSQRAIGGVSMGGFGSMSYAARHPDLFAVASSYSGAVDTGTGPEGTSPQDARHLIDSFAAADGGVPGSYFGLPETEEVRWRAHNPVDLAGNLHDVSLALFTGTGEPGPHDNPASPEGIAAEQWVHRMNVSFDERLDALGVAHDFHVRPGTHGYAYAADDLVADLPRIMGSFADPAPRPSRFTYTSADASFSVYRWEVAVDRAVTEFATIENASRRGFVLQGSGVGEVQTAPLYRPRARLRVTVGATSSIMRADQRGRLHVEVPLGPSNVIQQYRPGADTQVYTTPVTVSRP